MKAEVSLHKKRYTKRHWFFIQFFFLIDSRIVERNQSQKKEDWIEKTKPRQVNELIKLIWLMKFTQRQHSLSLFAFLGIWSDAELQIAAPSSLTQRPKYLNEAG